MDELVSLLLQSKNQAQVFHWRTGSYSSHITLQEFYEKITEEVDRLVETYQGNYGPLRNIKGGDLINDYKPEVIIDYFYTLYEKIIKLSSTIEVEYPNRALSSIIDDIIELFSQTNYKLEYLR